MSNNFYQERLNIRIEDYGPGFDPAKEVAGEGNKNLIYIFRETGAEVTVRGRGSGYIEPRTGRESTYPLHLLVEHESCRESFQRACRLAQNLIDTVKDDWLKMQGKPSRTQGIDDFYWRNQEENKDWYLSKTQNKDGNARSGSERRREWGSKADKRHVEKFSKDGFDDRRESLASRSDERNVWGTRRNGKDVPVETDSHKNRDFSDDRHGEQRWEHRKQYREERWLEPSNEGGTSWSSEKLDEGVRSNDFGRAGDSWSNKVWDDDPKWGGRSETGDARWDVFTQEENKGRYQKGFSFEEKQNDDDRFRTQKDKNRDHQGSQAKKRTWDMSSASDGNSSFVNQQKNVFGGIFDQKKITGEQVMNFREGGGFLGDVDPEPQPLNPIDGGLNLNPLQNLNHDQLLKVSQLQHSLLMQMSAALTQQPVLPIVNPVTSNLISNFQSNPVENPVSNPFLNLPFPLLPPPVPPPAAMCNVNFSEQVGQKEMKSLTRADTVPGTSFSNDGGTENNDRFSHLSEQSRSLGHRPPMWEEEKYLEDNLERRKHSSDVRKRSPEDWRRSPGARRHTSEVRRRSPRPDRRSNPRKVSPERSNLMPRRDSRRRSPLRRSSPSLDPPYLRGFPSHRISPDRNKEKLLQQFNEGQERYSPELEVFSRDTQHWREDSNILKSGGDSTLDRDSNKLQKLKIAVIDKNLNKLTSQDETEIKKIILNQALAFSSKTSEYEIFFDGFDLKDYVYLLLPHNIKCMQWLLDLKYLESGRRSYTLIAYEDIYNRYRLKTVIPFNILEGYCPTPEEVILEVGRINENLTTIMWKSVKFTEEKKGFFFMVSVDFLSYLLIRKAQWKVRYRTSFIKLEPIKSDRITDERFNFNRK